MEETPKEYLEADDGTRVYLTDITYQTVFCGKLIIMTKDATYTEKEGEWKCIK